MKRLVLATATLAALVMAAQAGAADYKVFLGEQVPCGFAKIPGCPAGVPKGTTLDQYFPGKVTIVAGDKVTFSSATFHTASYVPKRPPLLLSDPTKGKYAAMNDAAGQPFFFGGLPKSIYNGEALAPYGPKSISTGTPASSGALSPKGPKAPPATATFTFPKAGVYKLYCTIHPGMTGTVVVKPAGTTAPLTPTQVTAAALQDVNDTWAKAKSMAAAAKPPAKTVYMGLGKDATIYGYFPDKLTVAAGSTVTFVNRAVPEPHNVTFGPKKYIEKLQKTTDLFPQGPKSPNQVSPFASVGSDPKSAYSYDGTNHGNGFFSPIVTVAPGGALGAGLPHSFKVTFTKAGKYKFFCWIHGPDMAGEIDVTP